jgi:SAM-dependent methyltransferase
MAVMMGAARWYGRYAARVMRVYASDLDRYRAVLTTEVRRGDRLLHVGCGWDRSEVARRYTADCEVIGVDVALDVAGRYPGQFWRTDAARLPFAASTFDVACCEYLLEHLTDPGACFAEISRVLRPGGRFVLLTPNRWSYKALAAAISPHWAHRLLARRLRPDARAAADVFPTLYRANTPAVIRRLAAAHDFVVESLDLLNNGPTWFRRMPGIFEIGHLYHRTIDRIEGLASLRCGILACLQRRGQGPRTRELAVRCTICGSDRMDQDQQGYTCPRCSGRYLDLGAGVDAMARPSEAREGRLGGERSRLRAKYDSGRAGSLD